MSKLKRLYINIGKNLFQINDKLDIQQLDNGYVFSNSYFKTVKDMMPQLQKALKNILNNNINIWKKCLKT